MAATILTRYDILKDNIDKLFSSLDNFLFWFKNQFPVSVKDNSSNSILKLQRFCSIYNHLLSELFFWKNGSIISNLHSNCVQENCEGREWYYCIDSILQMYESLDFGNLAPLLQTTMNEKLLNLEIFSARFVDYCAKLEDCYLSLKKCLPSVKFAENNDIQKHFKFISYSVDDTEVHNVDMKSVNFSSRENFENYFSVLMQSAESSTRAETVALENLAIVALSGTLGISARDKNPESEAEAEFEDHHEDSNPGTSIFVNESFSENEKALEDYIIKQLENEAERQENNIRLVFDMVALYSKEGYSFQSFLLMLENASIRFKTSTIQKLAMKQWYINCNAKRKKAARQKVWDNAKDFIYRVGSDMYAFLKDFATLKKEKRSLNAIYEKYPNMPSNINLSDLAPLIEKVYKEDYLVLRCCQNGFRAIKNHIVDLVTDQQTISLFKSGECEKAYDKVFKEIQLNNARPFTITSEKKAVLQNILSEYTSADNPFQYDLRRNAKPPGSYHESSQSLPATSRKRKRKQVVVSVDTPLSTEIATEDNPPNEDQLLDPAVAFTEISSTIAAQKRKNAKTDIIQDHIEDDEATVIMRTEVEEKPRLDVQIPTFPDEAPETMRTEIVEKPLLDMEVSSFPHKAPEAMRTEVVEEFVSPMQLEAASPVEGIPRMLTNYSTPGRRRKTVMKKNRNITTSDDEETPESMITSVVKGNRSSMDQEPFPDLNSSNYSGYKDSPSFFDETETSFISLSGPEKESIIFPTTDKSASSRQIFLASTFSLLRKYFTEDEIRRGLEGQCSLPSDIRSFSHMPEDSTVFQSSFLVTDSLHAGLSQLVLTPSASSASDIFPAEISKTSPAPTSSSENVITKNLPIPSTSSVKPESAAASSFATDTSKSLSATGIENLPAKVSPTPTSSNENVMTENLPIPSTSSVNSESAAAPSFATDTSKSLSATGIDNLSAETTEEVSEFLPEGFTIVPSAETTEVENSNLSSYCEKLFTKASLARGSVKVFNCPPFSDEKLDSFFISGLLSLTVHSLRLMYMAGGDEQISEPGRYWTLLRLFQNTGGEQLLNYKAVSEALNFNNTFINRETLLFNFDVAVKACFSEFYRSKPSKNSQYDTSKPFVLDPIAIDSFPDTQTFVENFRILNDQKLNDKPLRSLPPDNRLIFVPVKKPVDNNRVKRIPLRFVMAPKQVYQTTGAIYSHPITMQTTVEIITRSKLEVFESRYAVAKYTPAADKSSVFVERARVIRDDDLNQRIPIPCIQPDGSLLVGFVLILSKPQSTNMDSYFSYKLEWELSRKSAYGGYGAKEYQILTSCDMWLNDDIINCMLGKLVDHFDNERRNNWPIHSAFFTYLVSTTESSSERLRVATVKPKGMISHKMPTINYASVSRQFDAINPFAGDNLVIHIPVNYKRNLHWSYVCLDCQTESILLFDSKYSSPSPDQSGFIFKHIHCFLECLFRERFPHVKEFRPWTVKLVASPDQIDGDNCGIFVLMNAARILWQRHRKPGYNLTTPWLISFSPDSKNEIRTSIRDVLFANKGIEEIVKLLYLRPD